MKRKPIEQKKNLAQGDTQVNLGSTKKNVAAGNQGGFLAVISPLAFIILLFFAMTVQTARMSLILCVLAVLSLLGMKPILRIRSRICIPVLGLLAFAVIQGAAAIYSPFDVDAVSEYYKFIATFALVVILLARFDKEDVSGLLWGFSGISAAIGAVSVDLACSGPLFQAFNTMVELLGSTFSDVKQSPWGTQVAGIYNDANVTACLFALGSLISLYLLSHAEGVKKKLPVALLLGINALSFFLSMSRGAILCFGFALLVWLVIAGKGNRLPLFFLMAVSAISTVALSIPGASHIISGSQLPLALLFVNGLVIFGLDVLLVRRLSVLVSDHVKLGAGIAAGVVVLCGVYAVAAFSVKGPYTFDASEAVSRSVKLAPGDYTLEAPLDPDVRITILGQTSYEKIQDQYTLLYDTYSGEVSFTVPEDLAVVQFQLYAPEGTTVDAVTFSDGSSYQLGYPLLPAFVANRVLVGMGSSFSTRVIFDQDAWKVFLKAPVFGHGLGSTENLYRSVQSFQYESKYAHNHVLQTMCDTGSVGLIFALCFVLGSGWLCWQALRKEKDSCAAMLLAVWVMMNLHSLMEISFSVRGFRCFAYTLLALPILLYAEPLVKLETAKARKVSKVLGITLSAAFALYLAVFGGLLENHRSVEREAKTFQTTSVREYLDTLRSHVKRDVFVQSSNELNYVAYAVQLKDPYYNGAMRKYVQDLRDSGVYENCSGLSRYYYLPRGEWEDLFACSREGIQQVRSSPDGWNLQMDFYRAEVLPAMGAENLDSFLDGVLALGGALDNMNSEGRMETVSLSEENEAFLTLCRSVKEQGLEGDIAYALLVTASGAAETQGE